MMRSAADREDGTEKHVAMENRLWPMRELLGDMLLELKQPAPALKEFETSLHEARNRLRSYYGAAKAAEARRDRTKAAEYYGKSSRSRRTRTRRATRCSRRRRSSHRGKARSNSLVGLPFRAAAKAPRGAIRSSSELVSIQL